eukprot:CAMPEP_0172763686 /NCGR_PEP_ID=MMETSP1074-20121228/175829_1 /TAXON_ID=2916 /ORGANISM="Ceratium fusus, Strain PA161109" /LENGTH=91 /DNA_ID=CAMNT_0013598315 /DNA_START=281 /DNA_END=557 /DNA_ORIENTATION=-
MSSGGVLLPFPPGGNPSARVTKEDYPRAPDSPPSIFGSCPKIRQQLVSQLRACLGHFPLVLRLAPKSPPPDQCPQGTARKMLVRPAHWHRK